MSVNHQMLYSSKKRKEKKKKEKKKAHTKKERKKREKLDVINWAIHTSL